jgi:hypothetical protein
MWAEGGSAAFFDERYSRAHNRIAMPAYPVAQGLARAWWLFLAGRSGTIRLRRFRDGFALPDIRFEPDGLPVIRACQRSRRWPVERLFGRRGFTVASGRVRGLCAEAYRHNGASRIIVADLPVPQWRTFAMMRAIGDFLAFQQEGRSPITDVYSYRQGVGRSFAVEMLAPAETILQMERDGMTPDEIASARNVSELAISWHLENHRAQPA